MFGLFQLSLSNSNNSDNKYLDRQTKQSSKALVSPTSQKPAMAPIKLLLFASLRDYFSEEREISIDSGTSYWANSNELKMYLLDNLRSRWLMRIREIDRKAQLSLPDPRTFMLVINESYVDTDEPISLSERDTLALIPPVTGG